MRILVWNIQFFTKNRVSIDFDNPADDILGDLARAGTNLNYIVSTVEQSDADLFVIVEPQVQSGEMQKIASGGGPDGLLYILTNMRARMRDNDWMLVPPLRMNPKDHLSSRTYTECAGIFWRNSTLDFRGPWIWTTQGAKPTGTGVAYADPWVSAVPNGNTFAGRNQFATAGGSDVTFPEEYNRRPFLTSFAERAPPQRIIDLFSVHTSPKTAQKAVALLSSIGGIAPQANHITIFAGDFNLDLNASNTVEWTTLHHSFPTIIKLIQTPQVRGNVRQGTRVVKRTDATAANYLQPEAIDYAFVGYGANSKVPPDATASVAVVDRVRGDPARYTSDLLDRYATLRNMYDTGANDASVKFRNVWNYGHISQPQRARKTSDDKGDGTSDHLPILITI